MQKTIDSTLKDARLAGCDTVQLKHDGLPAQFAIAEGNMNTSSFSLYPLSNPVTGLATGLHATLVGVYHPTHNTRHVFDCWCMTQDGTFIDLRNEPYRSRFVAARVFCKMLGDSVKLVDSWPITQAETLWSTLGTSPAKGLVFRDSRANAHSLVRVARYYKEAPCELT